nr:MAG TPA: hypothetical protein [Caudoviricetes sp.]
MHCLCQRLSTEGTGIQRCTERDTERRKKCNGGNAPLPRYW